MTVSEQPNAERASILSFISTLLLRGRKYTHLGHPSHPPPVQNMEEVLSEEGKMGLYWIVGK